MLIFYKISPPLSNLINFQQDYEVNTNPSIPHRYYLNFYLTNLLKNSGAYNGKHRLYHLNPLIFLQLIFRLLRFPGFHCQHPPEYNLLYLQ